MEPINPIPQVWASSHGFLHRDRLRDEARALSRERTLPLARQSMESRFQSLRRVLEEKFRLETTDLPLDFQVHGKVAQRGYEIQRISFVSTPGVRVTGNLYVPEGDGPFPAVLNMHGHWPQGKIAERVQARGHILAQYGIVTLSVDAAGAGERGEVEREWAYHGAMKGAEILLGGDSLMGQLIRDNRRALDVLQALPFVDSEKIGATGASGGGNQTMWLSALDERVKVAVLVVSVGSFEAYVTERNCMCETLPGGLQLAEEWEVLSLIAPRPLLILNALHEVSPAFQHEPMGTTCRQLQEVYSLFDARERMDWRLLDMPHGYHEEALQTMLGWMQHWLLGKWGSSPSALPTWQGVPEQDLLCYLPSQRPEECGYRALRQAIRIPQEKFQDFDNARTILARIIGWKAAAQRTSWLLKRELPNRTQVGVVMSPRSLPLPVALSSGWERVGDEIWLILSPLGKNSSFAREHWRRGCEKGFLVAAADLPGVGELAWETDEVGGTRLHDTARACLWLGYTLAGEWAEAISALCQALRSQVSNAKIRVLAEDEAVFAALLSQVLCLEPDFLLEEFGCPASAMDCAQASMVWGVPGFFSWGDLPLLRQLAQP